MACISFPAAHLGGVLYILMSQVYGSICFFQATVSLYSWEKKKKKGLALLKEDLEYLPMHTWKRGTVMGPGVFSEGRKGREAREKQTSIKTQKHKFSVLASSN